MSAPEIARTHAVSKEDVGHETTTAARHDGFARRTKLKTFKTKHDRTTRKTNDGQSSSDGEAADGDDSDEDDDENSSEKDDDETEADEPDLIAPSGGASTGLFRTGRLDSIIDDTSIDLVDSIENDNRQAGLTFHTDTFSTNQKRRRSADSEADLFNDIGDEEGQGVYPRKKVSRRLSNGANGLLVYDDFLEPDLSDDFAIQDYEKAIESSDDEDIARLEQADETQDSIEKREELLIIQEIESGDNNLAESFNDDGVLSHLDLGRLDHHADFLFGQTIDDDEDHGPNQELNAESYFTNGRKQSDSSVKRVRFEDKIGHSRSSSDSSSDTELDIFPDLLDKESLPAFMRTDIERDIDLDTGVLTPSDEEGSCWDFGEDEASKSFFAWHDVHTESESDGSKASDGSLSGYDSDGDTTDDDLPPPTTVRAPKSLLHRRTPSAANSVVNTPKSFPRSKQARKGPVLGSFVVDHRKAQCYIDPNTQQLRICRAPHPSVNPFQPNSTESSVTNSPQVAMRGLASDSDDHSELSHLFTGPSDVMMSGVFGGLPGQRYQNGRFVVEANGPLLIGPPEAFYPFVSIRSDGTPDSDDAEEYETDDEFDDDIDLTAFLDMDEYDDEDEEELEDDDATSPTTTDAAQLIPGNGHKRVSQSLIDHFDLGVVNSFRNNQERYRAMSRLPHDIASLSAPVRNGKSAETLMTPPRKRKSSNSHETVPRRQPVMGGFR